MKQRKNRLSFSVLLVQTAGLLWSVGCTNQSERPAHHEGHDRHNMVNHQVNNTDSVDMSLIVLPTNYSVISSQKTVKPVWSEHFTDITSSGYISVDERRDQIVSSRFSGRIDKLFVKYNFQYVKKGEKIMKMYSPELNTIQEELLFLLKSKSNEGLVKKAEEKLKLMGISDSQLSEIEITGKVFNSITVTSPYEGYVYFINDNSSNRQEPDPVQMSGMGNGNTNMNSQQTQMSNSRSHIREGIYVNKGQMLFKVNDLKEVFGIVLIENEHSAGVSSGTDVELRSDLDNTIIKAKISLLEPILQNGQKFVSARVYLKNESGLLKINSLLTAKFNSITTKTLFIPSSSIIFLGGRNIVWLKTGSAENKKYIFQAHEIASGASKGNMTEITGGLTDKDEIALDAGYMMDRESLIKPK